VRTEPEYLFEQKSNSECFRGQAKKTIPPLCGSSQIGKTPDAPAFAKATVWQASGEREGSTPKLRGVTAIG